MSCALSKTGASRKIEFRRQILDSGALISNEYLIPECDAGRCTTRRSCRAAQAIS
jgi:hypothetical protein